MENAAIADTLRVLRQLAGLELHEVAARCGISVGELEVAERRGHSPSLIRSLADFYGVDGDRLLTGNVAGDDGEDASVFLFNGDLVELHQGDLPKVFRALNHARDVLRGPQAQAGLARRLACCAVGVATSRPSGPAKQGVRLAKQLRGLLQLGGQPLGDMRLLAEDCLGVVVVTEQLATPALQAISVRGQSRSAAAMLLREGLDVWKQRTAVAHELCHLLFDPPNPYGLEITLDRVDRGGVRTVQMEQRARAFSQELLLPTSGLIALLGPPRRESDEDRARAMVREACVQFGTYWEQTTNDLDHGGFISKACRYRIHGEEHELPPPPETSLPKPGAPSLFYGSCWPDDVEPVQAARLALEHAKRTLAEQRMARRMEAQERVLEFKQRADGSPMRAGIELAKTFDRALDAGDPLLVAEILGRIDPFEVDGDATVGLLGNYRRLFEDIGEPVLTPFRTLAERTLDSLVHQWRWEQGDVADARDSLLG
ncbi:MAG: helix-turn-helix domain-containing protein [Alphaproteobacteria bacterium]|nr:helix-turn-helix domain-containing protein [Alphaproteobacteria bacterium]MCB9795322.1 helix-turn-helix domain-containing protein [Alphaproteobacteria bacterium]